MGIFIDGYGLTPKGFLATVALVGVATSFGGCVGCASCNNYDYSNGTRTGVINKLSKKGFIWKTYEGEMALEGIVTGGNSVGANVWNFSIDNQAGHRENVEELAAKLNQALESGTKIKVKYIEAGAFWPTRGETSYYIQSVEPAKKE